MGVSYAFGMHSSRRMHWSNAEEREESPDRRRVGVGYLPKQTRDKLNHKQNDLFETILLPELFLHCLCQFWIDESRSSIRADGSTKQQHIRLGSIPNVRTPLTTCTHSNAPSPGSSGSRVASTPAPTATAPLESVWHTPSLSSPVYTVTEGNAPWTCTRSFRR